MLTCEWIVWYLRLPDGSLMEITKVYPLDAVYDTLEDVPEDVMTRYSVYMEKYYVVKYILNVFWCYLV